MDPRHPQHPFSRTTASSYSHAPFQTSPTQAPFPSSSHPSNAPPLFPENQRRTSESNYYSQPSPYSRDSASVSNAGHSRHTSTSSITHGPSVSRSMPPPSSPQQQHQQQPQHPQHSQNAHSITYPPPPLSRGPPPSLGTPIAFPNNRDLPSLSSVHRPSSVNSSMSISSMLGGPPDNREPVQPASQYPAPPPMMASAPPPTSYPAPMQVSPRTSTIGPEYGRFRRPRTPDHRIHETQGLRDRANSAGSPPGGAPRSTPDAHRYGTPQGYSQRNVQHQQTASLDDRQNHYPLRVPNPNSAFPPRPSSQPASFSGPPPRLAETSRLVADASRPEPAYARSIGYGEREDAQAFREPLLEGARPEEEALLRRERERIEHMDQSHYPVQAGPVGHDALPYGRQYTQQQSGTYSDPRDPSPWMMRARQEQPAPEHPSTSHAQVPVTIGYEYPRTTAHSYGGTPAYASHDPRYPPGSYGPGTAQQRTPALSQFESPIQDRQRMTVSEQGQHQTYQGPTGAQPGPYRLHESPRARAGEDSQQLHRGGYLGVQQEINRKGRSSPFPQAVQGAQGQLSGPGGEPGIKSEFGKMFSGIGSGVGSMATAAATSSGAQTPFSNPGQQRREELDGLMLQDSMVENGGHKIVRTSSRGGRRRKLKEEDSKGDDDSSAGRRTPSGRGSKRPKHHQMGVTHRHIPRQDSADQGSSPSQPNLTAFNSTAAPQVDPSTTLAENKIIVPHHHHINRHHHHHHHVGAHHRSTPVPAPAPTPVAIPKPKQIVKSKVVLDSVAHLPRRHLGHGIYQTRLKAGIPPSVEHFNAPRRGFASTPEPLPRFEGQENCTYTVRIPRVHLTSISREEITSRRAVWGTEIYTDDSDVIAACIHSGWIRGEWPDDVDVSLLGLIIDATGTERNDGVMDPIANGKEKDGQKINGNVKKDILLTQPPPTGPMVPLENYDLHVTVLILPALEKYSSSVRWGIMSRAWSGTHDGLSFMIMNIRWVAGVDTAKETTGKARRMRMKPALEEDGFNEEKTWSSLLENGNGHRAHNRAQDAIVRESFVRGDGGVPSAELSGLGIGSWWKEEKRKLKCSDKEAVAKEERISDERQQSEVMVLS